MHQPLHAASYFSSAYPSGDQGGNAWAVAGVNYTAELHAVWDSGCGQWINDIPRPLTPAGSAYLSNFSAAIMSTYPQTDPTIAPLILETDPLVWATESNALAQSFAYTANRAPTPLTDAYLEQGQAMALRQIAIGGYRLAALLEYIFTANDENARAWREEAASQLRAADRPAPRLLRRAA